MNGRGTVWVEGELIKVDKRGSAVFGTLRDLSKPVSISIIASSSMLPQLKQMGDGARVVVEAKLEFWGKSSNMGLRALSVRHVGLGERLAALHKLSAKLEAEGLFDPAHRKPLPFLPSVIGLITGRASDAEHDVRRNVQLRWPAAELRVKNVATQGAQCVPEVTQALITLDADPAVDVIIIARGGGGVEELLPFSDESLVRAVFDAKTPVISAIGHEKDAPLLDLVADLRASTPTDAAKQVVPDMAEEVRQIGQLQDRSLRAVMGRLEQHRQSVEVLRSRSGLRDAYARLAAEAQATEGLQQRARTAIQQVIGRDVADVQHLAARVFAVSPAQTLARGYAVLQDFDGTVIRSPQQVRIGQPLLARVADGSMRVQRSADTPREEGEA